MSSANGNLLNRIADAVDDMNRSEKKVAQFVLAEPEKTTGSSIASVAQASGVSEPTVNRFCKKYGATGFPDFKLKLAQCLASGIRYLSESVLPDDDVDAYSQKIIDASVNSLVKVRETLNLQQIDRAVDKLIQAKRIFFFGLGASSSVARDAEYKFFRFNLPVSFYDDVLMQRMLASSGNTGDVFFCISHTGRTRSLVKVARLARESGATVLGMTAADSPLAAASTLSIDIQVAENTDEYMPMTSRLAHMVVLDVLAAGVTLRRGVEFQPYLKRIKDSLKETRYPQGE